MRSTSTFQASAYRGETLDIRARLLDGAHPLPVPAGAEAAMLWQTNGMGAAWWSVPATVSTSGVVEATWTPTNDVGAASYRVFLGVAAGGRNWRANLLLRLIDAPGASPNELEPPIQSIDFSLVEVSNAPWIEEEADPTVPAWAKAENPPVQPIKPETDPLFQGWKTNTYPSQIRFKQDMILSVIGGGEVAIPMGNNVSNLVYVPSSAGVRDAIAVAGWSMTNYTAGAVAALKSQVETGWWGKWTITRNGVDITAQVNQPFWHDGEGGWIVTPATIQGDDSAGEIAGTIDDSELSWQAWELPAYVEVAYTAKRRRIAGPVGDYVLQSKKELHADSATNIVWMNVYSNGWVFLKAYTNELSEAY